jgi:nitrite reductase/ring-hydroxylating ferredoxin subunit
MWGLMLTTEAGFCAAGPANLSLGVAELRQVAGRDVIVARGQDGVYYAVAAQCSHAALPLDGGRVRGSSIVCPHHGARFCLKTGRVLGPPAHEGITAYPTRQEGDEVMVWPL